jgi:hypothetical protein
VIRAAIRVVVRGLMLGSEISINHREEIEMVALCLRTRLALALGV